MKARLVAAFVFLGGVFLLAPASAQVSLVVGSVRDQHGVPITGATISASTSAGRTSTTTDNLGTFALKAADVTLVAITCRYCASVAIAVRPGEPVVAIVRRYDALLGDSPSPSDLENLPYAHVESAVALRPFTLLAQSSTVYPGSRVSDRGLSSSGSLLIDNGAPTYDIVAGESPYFMIPADYQQSTKINGAENAFLYGDQAAGGVVELQPFVTGLSSQVATAGSDAIARAEVGSDASSFVVGSFSNDEESRQRADVSAAFTLPADQSLLIAGGTEQGRVYSSAAPLLASSFSFTDATFNDPRALNLALTTVLDRGSYDAFPTNAGWSDSGFGASIHTSGTVSGFADLATRSSTGFYDEQTLPSGMPILASTLIQTRADVGFDISEPDYEVMGGVGTFWINYAGGAYGQAPAARAELVVPSLTAQLLPSGKWSATFQGSGAFTLPTFLQQYQYAGADIPAVEMTRNSLLAAELTYTDNARVRASFEEATQNVSGASSGTVTSAGLSATWQIAPAISLRAWTMHVTDTAPVYPTGLPPYGGVAPTVNAFWLSYDNNAAVRIDVIYRRDLLENAPFYHFDAAISGPIVDQLRWYAGSEDWMHRTFVNVGLRFAAR